MMVSTSGNKWQVSSEHRIRILALSRTVGFGISGFKHLLEKFGSIDAVFSLGVSDLASVVKMSVAKIIGSKSYLVGIDKYLSQLRHADVSFLTLLDPEYPEFLSRIYDPPMVLYYKGDFRKQDFEKCFSVVGTRTCTRYGEEVTEAFVQGLVQAGFIVVSGMAFGIDRKVHEAAIHAGGRTIAVLSGRVDMPSPRSNFQVYRDILENGFVLSECHLDRELVAGMFPARNRIISGISCGSLIIEAGKKSGALITAKAALEQGREVFAIPSDIFNKKGEGTNNLIKNGEAKLVQTVSDILEEFGFEVHKKAGRKKTAGKVSPVGQKILDFLIQGSASADEIARGLGIDISGLLQEVIIMEVNHRVVKTAQNKYAIAN